MEQLMQGLANKEIARELATSPKTVGHHLQSIYKKLGRSKQNAGAGAIQGITGYRKKAKFDAIANGQHDVQTLLARR